MLSYLYTKIVSFTCIAIIKLLVLLYVLCCVRYIYVCLPGLSCRSAKRDREALEDHYESTLLRRVVVWLALSFT